MAELSLSKETSFIRWCIRLPVELVGALLTVLMTFVVFLEVVLRYAVHSPLAWSEESAMFLWQWFNFLGAAVAVRHSRHVRVDLILGRLHGRPRTVADLLSSASVFAVAYMMIHMGLAMMSMSMNYIYPVLRFSMGYAYLAFPISGALMILFQIPIFLQQVRALKKGE
jgi:TRAP-type transport system small permease protein